MKRPVKSFSNPTLEAAVKTVRDAIEKSKALMIIGNCWVNYQGRASSTLGLGERIVIIKEDKSLLVHRPHGYEPVNWMPGGKVTIHVSLVNPKRNTSLQNANQFSNQENALKNANGRIVIFKEDGSRLVHRSTGYEPVNWQPPSCLFSVNATNRFLQIRAIRRKPSESVKIFFDKIYLVSVLDLVDKGEFSLYASEEDMQRALLLEPSLLEEGFKPLTYEKKIEPGFVDIYGTDKNGKFVVVEIKRKPAGKQAVLQLANYVKSIRSMVNRDVRGVLVAPSMAKGVQRLLATLKLDFKALDPKKCASILRKPKTKRLVEFFEENR